MTEIGDFIQEEREKKEMTVAQLASRLPISPSTLGQIERGEIVTPSAPVLSALATALSVSVGRLSGMLGEDVEPRESVQPNKSNQVETLESHMVKLLVEKAI